jgi:hypothetical protein
MGKEYNQKAILQDFSIGLRLLGIVPLPETAVNVTVGFYL